MCHNAWKKTLKNITVQVGINSNTPGFYSGTQFEPVLAPWVCSLTYFAAFLILFMHVLGWCLELGTNQGYTNPRCHTAWEVKFYGSSVWKLLHAILRCLEFRGGFLISGKLWTPCHMKPADYSKIESALMEWFWQEWAVLSSASKKKLCVQECNEITKEGKLEMCFDN